MLRLIVLGFTHGATLLAGIALGIYLLPILTAPASIDRAELAASAEGAVYSTEFTRDLAGSDFLHWGEGRVSLTLDRIVHEGTLAPGPDYKLYLVPGFVEDEAQFLAVKDQARVIGDVKTFDGFALDLPEGVSLDAYTTVLVWCESFGEFITAAAYR